MASTIELQCPNCQMMLELDGGFAGGVCRCSSCAALMTVPADVNTGEAETLTRPSRPDGPALGSEAARSARPQSPKAVSSKRTTEADATTYTTTSGRVVHLSSASVIPLAPAKKKAIRAATAIVFGGGVLLILIAFVTAIVLLMNQETSDEISAREAAAFTFQREVDPYTLADANVIGLPLQKRTAVIVNADYRSGGWIEDIAAALTYGLTQPDAQHTFCLIYTGETEPHVLSADFQTPSSANAQMLAAFQAGMDDDTEPLIGPAVKLAVMMKATHIVMILGHELSGDELDAIREAVGKDSSVVFDFVMIDKDDPDLEDYAKQTGGLYVPISKRLMGKWLP